MQKWNPPIQAIASLQGERIGKYDALDLFTISKFYHVNWFWKMFGKGGIAWSEDKIVVSDKVINSTNYLYQAIMIYHELVHISQQLDMGWRKFMFNYVGEWIKSGFSYAKMKTFGFELEAYTASQNFGHRIGYWG